MTTSDVEKSWAGGAAVSAARMQWFLLTLCLLGWLPETFAFSSYKTQFNTRYSTAGSRLDSCVTCHTTASSPGPLNPYGTVLQDELFAGNSFTGAMAAAEPGDSDGDGFTNLAEILARTFPGNPSDFPVAATPNISVAPTILAFGTVNTGASKTMTVSVSNTGSAPLTVSGLSLTGTAEFSLQSPPAAPFNLAASGSVTLTVQYAPTAAGVDSGSLVISSNDPDTPTVTVSLSATGAIPPAPNIAVTPATLGFATVNVGSDKLLTATISNTGNAALTVGSVTLTGSLNFSLPTPPATPFSIAANSSVTLSVRYAPTGIGNDSGSIVIASNDSDTPTTSISLSGTGAASALAASPLALDFGQITVGNSRSLLVTINNNGTAAGTVNSLILNGSTDFALGATAPKPPFTVSPGSSVTVPVNYMPGASGASSGSLQIGTDSISTPTLTVTLAGVGGAPQTAIITTTPSSLAFGAIPVGASTSLTVTIGNAGVIDFTVSALALSGSTDFSMGAGAPTTPFVVTPGAQVTLTVLYTASNEGSDSGALQITSDAANQTQAAVTLAGSGITSHLSLAPTSVAFGTVTVGSSASRTVTLTNSGGLAASVTAISLDGNADFDLGTAAPTAPITVAANGSVTFPLVFVPSAAGAASGQLNLATDDAKSPLLTAALSGVGSTAPAGPNIAVNPPALAFGKVAVGGTSKLSVAIQNTGDTVLTVQSLVMSGSSDFKLDPSAPARPFQVAAGASVNIAVLYRPDKPGADTGALQIVSNDADTPTATVSLTGEGTQSVLAINPSSLNFGSVTVGASKTLSVRATNSGNGAATINSAAITGNSAFTLNSAVPAMPATVAPGASVDIAVNYTPAAKGSHNGTLQITTSDPRKPKWSVSLKGSAPKPTTPQPVRLNIAGFTVTREIEKSGDEIEIRLTVNNVGKADQPRPATVTGTQNNVTVYNQTQTVSDPVGGRPTSHKFPSYKPAVTGEIIWTVTVNDDDLDRDWALARTKVMFHEEEADDEDDDRD